MKSLPFPTFTRCPENASGLGLKFRSQWRRSIYSLFSLTILALCSISATAQQNWIDADLGGPAQAGSVVTNGDSTLTITGGGDDIWNGTSRCNYYYAWASGTTWDIVCQVQSFAGPDTWSKVELMIDKADPKIGPQGNDAFIAVMGTQPSTAPPGGVSGVNQFGNDQFRTTAGGNADWVQVGTTPTPQYPNAWMKIHRNGSVFQLYYSRDGVTWTNYINLDTSNTASLGGGSSTTFSGAWPDVVAVGIAVTAHNNTAPNVATATIAHLSATFPAITAPTVLNATTQVANTTAYSGSEASFSFVTTNNSNPNIVLPSYQWYKNNVALPGATGTSLTWLATPADNGAHVYCVATIPPPYNTTVSSLTSATGTLTVASSILVTNGWKTGIYNASGGNNFSYIRAVEAGNTAPARSMFVQTNGDNPGGYGNNYVSRTSGYFIPPTTDYYVFFVDVDDNADLLLNTNTANGTDPAGKVVIAQQTFWAGLDSWLISDINGVAGGGNPPDWNQNRSDYYMTTNFVSPGVNGYLLNAGQLYYMELVHSQGGGGDNFGVTYQTIGQVNAGLLTLTNGQPSLITTASHNMAFMSYPDTTPTWTLQPTNIIVTAGTGGGFSVSAISGGEFAPNYQWYSNNVAIPKATSSSLYYAVVPASANGSQYYAVATGVMNGLSSTSAVVTLNIAQGVQEAGYAKVEWWYGSSLANLEAGTLPPSTNVITSPRFEADTTGSSGNNYVNRISTLFHPPTSGNYVFFIASDDQSDLFVSTDSTPGNKVKVATETGWSNARQWNTVGGGTSTVAQRRSDQYSPDAGATFPYSGGIPMTAGQTYYIEMDHQDTGGGDNAGATYKLISDPDPANGSASALAGSAISISVPRSFTVGFSQQPANNTATTFSNASFTVAGFTDSQIAVGGTGNDRPLWNNRIAYQWMRNGTPIPGATASTYSFGPVSPVDSGAQFTCQIRSLGYVDNTLTAIWSNSAPATLTVAAGQVFETGVALHQYWSSNPGRTAIETFSAGAPAWSMSTPAFEADITGTEVADNFCDDLLGYFIPSVSGNYVFFCNSDDDADLFLSTDDSFANSRMVAQQTSNASGALVWSSGGGTASQVRSDTFVDPNAGGSPYASGIPLVAGQKYAMQIVHHQGGGGTYSCVTAKLNTDPDPVDGTSGIIRGSMVGTYAPRCTYVGITNQPQSVTANNYASASFTVGAETDSTLPVGPEGDWRNSFNNFLTYQWYKNGVPMSGANSATYNIPSVLPSDANAQIYCTARALGYADNAGNPLWVTSSVVALTVNVAAPEMTYAAFYVNSNTVAFYGYESNYVTIGFSAPMDTNMLSQISTYTIGGGVSIEGVTVSKDGRSVALMVSGVPTFPLNVTVSSLLSGQGGGLPVNNTSVAVNHTPLTDVDIGIPGADPSVPGLMYVVGPQAYTIAAEGSDIYNNADGFNFAYEMKTNDFDVVVRQKNITHTSNWAKGGLMVRETLDAGSRNWNIVNDPVASDGIAAPDGSGPGANAVECNARNSLNGGTGGWGFNGAPVPAYPNAWVRLKRVGGLLSAYSSTNGTSWTLLATNTPASVGDLTALPAIVYVGICTTAHNNDASLYSDPLLYVNTVDYDNYNSSYVAAPSAPLLNASITGGNIKVTWTPNTGHLESSPALSGPGMNWQPVSGGTGGTVTVPITGSGMFFRVVTP
ncbi:MAG TPA: PA14 domain-containing protein [Verrucomicrobiae bacterium]|jgi:hypothetical protein